MDVTSGTKPSRGTTLAASVAGSSEQRLDYGKVIKLFVNELTAALEDRQMAAIRRVVRLNAGGCVHYAFLV